MENKTKIAFFIIFCIIMLLIVVFGSLALIKQHEIILWNTNPVQYCYTDWMCKDYQNTNNEINMSQQAYYNEKSGYLSKCSLLTEQTLESFPYIDNYGNEIVGNPGVEKNLWSDSPETSDCWQEIMKYCPNKGDPGYENCVANHTSLCPYYEIGGIYWPACSGNVQSRYYTNPKIYSSLQRTGLTLKNMKKN